MTLYLDSSAFVKRYLDEEGAPSAREAMAAADRWVACRIGYVETTRALGMSLGPGSPMLERFRHDWQAVSVVEVDAGLSDQAAELAVSHDLRTLDSLHLAAAVLTGSGDLTFATWDRRLWHVASEVGLRVLPRAL